MVPLPVPGRICYVATMIARLSGILAELTADGAVIDVGGVGYLVQVSGRALDALVRLALRKAAK
jgi:Holliday junction resolvasome RuvABC DNA-binding subunit